MRETHEPNLTVHVTPAGSAYCIYETGPTIGTKINASDAQTVKLKCLKKDLL
jgi:hypothetical protein